MGNAAVGTGMRDLDRSIRSSRYHPMFDNDTWIYRNKKWQIVAATGTKI